MFGDIEVQDVATAVADHEETVQYPEGGGGHGKKVQGGDSLTMVLEINRPIFPHFWVESSCEAMARSRRFKRCSLSLACSLPKPRRYISSK